MKKDVDATLNPRGRRRRDQTCCCAIASRSERRSAGFRRRLRLEEAIGPELTRRLVTSLTARSRAASLSPEPVYVAARADEQEDQEGADERDEERRSLARRRPRPSRSRG